MFDRLLHFAIKGCYKDSESGSLIISYYTFDTENSSLSRSYLFAEQCGVPFHAHVMISVMELSPYVIPFRINAPGV